MMCPVLHQDPYFSRKPPPKPPSVVSDNGAEGWEDRGGGGGDPSHHGPFDRHSDRGDLRETTSGDRSEARRSSEMDTSEEVITCQARGLVAVKAPHNITDFSPKLLADFALCMLQSSCLCLRQSSCGRCCLANHLEGWIPDLWCHGRRSVLSVVKTTISGSAAEYGKASSSST